MSFRRSFPMVLSFVVGWAPPVMHPRSSKILYAQAPPPAINVDRGATEASLSLGNNPPFHTTSRAVKNERLIDVAGSPVRVALVVSGLTSKSACCTQPFGVCKMLNPLKCNQIGGVVHLCETCPTTCEASQSPQGP